MASWLADPTPWPGEACPELAGRRASSPPGLLLRDQGPSQDLIKPPYLIKALFSDTVALEVRASTYEFGGTKSIPSLFSIFVFWFFFFISLISLCSFELNTIMCLFNQGPI